MRIPDYPAVVTTAVADDQFVRKGLLTGEEKHRCGICGYIYPESKLTFFEGKYYCHPHRCYEDIDGIITQRIAAFIPREEE